MLERVAVMVWPVVFLIVIFGGGAVMRRRNVDQDGKPPLNKIVFFTSKYLIVGVWTAMVLESWGIGFSVLKMPAVLKWVALALWVLGFVLLFIGRFGLGESFRLGSPKESTALKSDGLFGISRNPMYVGVYSTLLAAVIYTLNPVVLAVAVFVAAVHHKIVLAEERYLRTAYGDAYEAYCRRVRRYL